MELTRPQMLMLQGMIETDMDQHSFDAPEYTDIDLMQYYLDRATVYHIIKEELET